MEDKALENREKGETTAWAHSTYVCFIQQKTLILDLKRQACSFIWSTESCWLLYHTTI